MANILRPFVGCNPSPKESGQEGPDAPGPYISDHLRHRSAAAGEGPAQSTNESGKQA